MPQNEKQKLTVAGIQKRAHAQIHRTGGGWHGRRLQRLLSQHKRGAVQTFLMQNVVFLLLLLLHLGAIGNLLQKLLLVFLIRTSAKKSPGQLWQHAEDILARSCTHLLGNLERASLARVCRLGGLEVQL